MLAVDSGPAIVLGLDFDGTKLASAVVDAEAREIIAQTRAATLSVNGAETTLGTRFII